MWLPDAGGNGRTSIKGFYLCGMSDLRGSRRHLLLSPINNTARRRGGALGKQPISVEKLSSTIKALFILKCPDVAETDTRTRKVLYTRLQILQNVLQV